MCEYFWSIFSRLMALLARSSISQAKMAPDFGAAGDEPVCEAGVVGPHAMQKQEDDLVEGEAEQERQPGGDNYMRMRSRSTRRHHSPTTARTRRGTPRAEAQIIGKSSTALVPAMLLIACVAAASSWYMNGFGLQTERDPPACLRIFAFKLTAQLGERAEK